MKGGTMDEQDIFAAVSKDPAVLNRLVRAMHRHSHEHGYLWEPTDGCGCAERVDRLLADYDDEGTQLPLTVEPDDA